MNVWQREATHGQIEEITDYWNCDDSCTLASLLFGRLKISGIWVWLHRVYMFPCQVWNGTIRFWDMVYMLYTS